MFRKSIGMILLVAALMMAAQAEQVYVKNRPFKGLVSRSEGKIWVELKPFADALGWTLAGDEQTGYALYQGTSRPLPGQGKVAVEGVEVPSINSGAIQVALEDIAPLLGAKVVESKEFGTIDVSLSKGKDQVTAGQPQSISDAPYTLIEFSDPPEKLCKDIQPAVTDARAKFQNVQHVLCNVNDKGALQKYLKYKKVPDASFPEIVLVNSQGEILFQLRGNHVITKELLSEMRKKVKPN